MCVCVLLQQRHDGVDVACGAQSNDCAGVHDGVWAVVWATATQGDMPRCCPRQVFAGHEGEVSCGAFAGQAGKLVVTGSSDGTARLWNPKSGRCIQTFEGCVQCAQVAVKLPLLQL